MIDTLLAFKGYQTQGFKEDGKRIPLTVVLANGNVVSQVKTDDKEGYTSIQLGIGEKKRPNKSLLGKSKKSGLKVTPLFYREVRVKDADLEVGTEVNISEVLEPGDIVDVVGISKGKGFAGGVKRHHFKGGPRTHGQSDRERAPGSIGQTTTPGRVYKGKRMAGHMGHEQVTVKNLEIVEVREDGTILINGLVPGGKNNLLLIKRTGKNKKFVPLYKEVVEEPVVEEVQPEATEEVSNETEGTSGTEGTTVAKSSEEVQTAEDKVEDTQEAVETPEETVETEDTKVVTTDETVQTPEATAEVSEEEKVSNVSNEATKEEGEDK